MVVPPVGPGRCDLAPAAATKVERDELQRVAPDALPDVVEALHVAGQAGERED